MSIWNKLDRGAGVLVVGLPRASTPVRPAVAIDPAKVRVTIVDALDPESPDDASTPDAALLARLCDPRSGVLLPGYLALLPDADDVHRDQLAIVNGTLTIGGEPVIDRPFALLQLDLDDDDDPAALDPDALTDLERARRQLHHELAGRDRGRSAVAFRALIERIAAHPGLGATARWRLARGVEREYVLRRHGGLGAAPSSIAGWKAFVTSLPSARAGDRGPIDVGRILASVTPRIDTIDGGEVAAEPPPVHWNTRILDGERAITDDEIVAGRTCTIENKLDPAPAADAFFPFTEVKVALADEAPVTFIVECAEPVLRARGSEAWVERVEQTVAYDLATGTTPAAIVELRAEAAGKLSLAFSLLTDNVTRASSRARMTVLPAAPVDEPAAGEPAAATPAAPAARARVVTAAALRGKAELHLDLTPTGALQLRAGALVGAPCPPHKPPDELTRLTILARNELVALALDYTPGADGPFGLADGAAALTAMATIGARLHAAFFGLPGQRIDANLEKVARSIARADDARLQVAAAFQPYPWGVLYDGAWRDPPVPPERAADDPSGFWGRRFRIDRAIVGHVPEVPRLEFAGPLRVQPCINRHLDGQRGAVTIDVVEPQRRLFAPFASEVTAAAPIEREADLAAYLTTQPGPCDLLYFFCHATSAASLDPQFRYAHLPADEQATLVLDPDGGLSVAQMAGLRQAPLDDRPLVILNACGTTSGDQAFAPPLLMQFLDQWGAAGVLGTDWQVPALFADAFARRLFAHFVGRRRSLGDALAAARDEAFAQGNPFPLVYALYAPPELVIRPAAP